MAVLGSLGRIPAKTKNLEACGNTDLCWHLGYGTVVSRQVTDASGSCTTRCHIGSTWISTVLGCSGRMVAFQLLAGRSAKTETMEAWRGIDLCRALVYGGMASVGPDGFPDSVSKKKHDYPSCWLQNSGTTTHAHAGTHSESNTYVHGHPHCDVGLYIFASPASICDQNAAPDRVANRYVSSRHTYLDHSSLGYGYFYPNRGTTNIVAHAGTDSTNRSRMAFKVAGRSIRYDQNPAGSCSGATNIYRHSGNTGAHGNYRYARGRRNA